MNIKVNLIPPHKKEELNNLRIIGILTKIAFMAVLSLFTFYVFLSFCQWAIDIQRETMERDTLKFQQTDNFKKAKEVQDFFDESQKKSSKIKAELKKQESFYAIIDHLNSLIPENVILKELSIKNGDLRLTGVAFDRDSLLVLKAGLEQSDKLEKLESPISNIVSDSNIDFEFKAKIKK